MQGGHMEPTVITMDVEQERRGFMTRVYGWMSIGLALTAAVSWWVLGQPHLIKALVTNRVLFYGLLIGELLLVIGLSSWINRISVSTAIMSFLAYSAINGVTMSLIFLIYTAESIASTFFLTAGVFGAMSFYGAVTKRDLTTMGNFLLMALIGLVLASIVNLFMANSALYWIITYAGILIFVGLTAYDTQKLKALSSSGFENEETGSKAAIMGALTLYLDFINLFLMLLRVMGRRR